MLPALRHAMTLHPHTPYIFWLERSALIMSPHLPLDRHITSKKRLESLMIVNQPVVPPDSVIRTFAHLSGDKIDCVLTQDAEGLSAGVMVLRAGDWAKYFLDAWFDPLYRSYNFQKAEQHALEHIVQYVNPPTPMFSPRFMCYSRDRLVLTHMTDGTAPCSPNWPSCPSAS